MRRALVILTALLALGGVGAGVWRALHPPMRLVLVPGAADIEVIDLGAGAQLITYRAPGPPYIWRSEVARNLLRHGWVNPPWWRPDMPELTYACRSRFGFGALWYQADLRGEPNVARISVRRWMEIPWWWYVPWRIIHKEGPKG